MLLLPPRPLRGVRQLLRQRRLLLRKALASLRQRSLRQEEGRERNVSAWTPALFLPPPLPAESSQAESSSSSRKRDRVTYNIIDILSIKILSRFNSMYPQPAEGRKRPFTACQNSLALDSYADFSVLQQQMNNILHYIINGLELFSYKFFVN